MSAGAKAEIEEGAWTTPAGDPFVRIEMVDEGDCAYCSDIIYGYHAITSSGMRQAAPGTCLVWRWWGNRLEPWHLDCFERWLFSWTKNANGTVHIVGCGFAEPDGVTYSGTRGEARVMLDGRFCKRCAPIERWLDN